MLPLLGARLAATERSLVPAHPCRVLFLCKGNICRSAFAERVALRLTGSRSGWEFRSAGLESSPGTASPEFAVRVAREFGVDLEAHGSRSASPEDFSASDVAFVMEPTQRSRVRRTAGPIGPGVALLGAFCLESGPRPVIRDPFGHDVAAYRRVFEQIQEAVTAILARADSRRRHS